MQIFRLAGFGLATLLYYLHLNKISQFIIMSLHIKILLLLLFIVEVKILANLTTDITLTSVSGTEDTDATL